MSKAKAKAKAAATAEVAFEAEAQQAEEAQTEQTGAEKRRHDHYEQILSLNAGVIEAANKWLGSKNETAVLKKSYEAKADQLHRMIAAGPDMQLRLTGLEDVDEASPCPGWEDTPISMVLSLGAKHMEFLAEAGIETLGQLEVLRAGPGIDSVKGIGRQTADKIEEQILDWFQANRAEEAETNEDEDDDDD